MIICYISALIVCFITNLAVSHRLDWFFIVLAAELLAFSVTSLPGLLRRYKGEATLGAFYGSLLFLLAVSNGYTHAHWFGIAALSISCGLFGFFAPPLMKILPWPVYMANKKALIWLGGMTGFVFALTYAGNRLARFPLDYGTQLVPLLVFEFILAWLLLVLLRYARINRWMKAAAGTALGAVWILLQQGMLDMLFDKLSFKIISWDLRQWGSSEYMDGNILFIVMASAVAAVAAFLIIGTVKFVKTKKG